MAIILASFRTSSAEDLLKQSERAAQGKTPVNMIAPLGQSIAGNLKDSLPEADTLEVVDFVVSESSATDNSKWVNAYGFTEPTTINAQQVYLEVPDEDIDTSLEFLKPLLGLVWIDGEFENGLTLKQLREVTDSSDEEIEENARLFEVGLNQEIANATTEIGGQPMPNIEDNQNSNLTVPTNKSEGHLPKILLYTMGAIAVGSIVYAYKKANTF